MTNSPDLRAGDEDRDRTIGVLREAFAEGRLTNDEFHDRMDKAQRARTFGDLSALTTDLPSAPSGTSIAPRAVIGRVEGDRDYRKAWLSWGVVSVIVNVIWGVTWITNPDDVPYYWPIWVMVPWGLAMVAGWLTQRWR